MKTNYAEKYFAQTYPILEYKFKIANNPTIVQLHVYMPDKTVFNTSVDNFVIREGHGFTYPIHHFKKDGTQSTLGNYDTLDEGLTRIIRYHKLSEIYLTKSLYFKIKKLIKERSIDEDEEF